MILNTQHYYTLAALVALLPLTACLEEVPLLSIEAEIQEVCIVGLSSEFEASTDELGGIVSRVFGGQDLGITLDERFSAELFLSGVGMSANNDEAGVVNFDFIDSLRVSVSGGSGQPEELLRFEGGVAVGSDWFVATESAVDLVQYLEADDVQLRFELAGVLPTTAWSADMEICLTVRAGFVEKLPL